MEDIFKAMVWKESDPGMIWRALNAAYGVDYFIICVEEQYGKRFVANYNALYEEVDRVQQEANKHLNSIGDRGSEEVKECKRIIQEQ